MQQSGRIRLPHVGELILLAAPSCCGKTYFLEQLYGGRLQRLVDRMALEQVDSYVSVTPKRLMEYGGAYVPRMILHFAIPTRALLDGSLKSLEDEPRLDVVKRAELVTVITLLASANDLANRLRSRQWANRRRIHRSVSGYLSERRRLAKLKPLYAGSDNVVVAYEAWFEYVSRLTNLQRAWLVTAQSDYEAFEPNEWDQLRSVLFGNTRPHAHTLSD